jgi:hypothetical protein
MLRSPEPVRQGTGVSDPGYSYSDPSYSDPGYSYSGVGVVSREYNSVLDEGLGGGEGVFF